MNTLEIVLLVLLVTYIIGMFVILKYECDTSTGLSIIFVLITPIITPIIIVLVVGIQVYKIILKIIGEDYGNFK